MDFPGTYITRRWETPSGLLQVVEGYLKDMVGGGPGWRRMNRGWVVDEQRMRMDENPSPDDSERGGQVTQEGEEGRKEGLRPSVRPSVAPAIALSSSFFFFATEEELVGCLFATPGGDSCWRE